MNHVFTYEVCKTDLEEYIIPETKNHPGIAKNWMYEFDDSEITETERLNIVLAVTKWEIEHDFVSEEISDELYLYYEQYVNGELDDVIDPEEREEVVHDLTEFFNKVFPEGLED